MSLSTFGICTDKFGISSDGVLRTRPRVTADGTLPSHALRGLRSVSESPRLNMDGVSRQRNSIRDRQVAHALD